MSMADPEQKKLVMSMAADLEDGQWDPESENKLIRSYAKNGLKRLKIEKVELSLVSKTDQESKAMSSKTMDATARCNVVQSPMNNGEPNIKLEHPELLAVQEEIRVIMLGQGRINGFVSHAKKTLATLNTLKQEPVRRGLNSLCFPLLCPITTCH